MKRHVAEVKDREARRRAEDEEAAREFAKLEAQLKGAEGRACKAEAQADALADSRADLRRKVHALQRSIGRAEERLRVSSSGASSCVLFRSFLCSDCKRRNTSSHMSSSS